MPKCPRCNSENVIRTDRGDGHDGRCNVCAFAWTIRVLPREYEMTVEEQIRLELWN